MTQSQSQQPALTELEAQLISLMTGTIDSLQLGCSIAEYSEEMTAAEKRAFLDKVLTEIDIINRDVVAQRKQALEDDNQELAEQLKKRYASNIKLKLALDSQYLRIFHYL